MKYSLGIFNFLEEISYLSHSIVCRYFFALITVEGFLIYPLLFFGTLHSNGYIFRFLLCLSLFFYLQLFARPPHAGGAPQKERGSGTYLSKAEGSGGEVSLLSANPAPHLRRDNQTWQGFCLSSSALLLQALGLYRQARGFCEGWANHVKGQIVICHSCTNHTKGQILI